MSESETTMRGFYERGTGHLYHLQSIIPVYGDKIDVPNLFLANLTSFKPVTDGHRLKRQKINENLQLGLEELKKNI